MEIEISRYRRLLDRFTSQLKFLLASHFAAVPAHAVAVATQHYAYLHMAGTSKFKKYLFYFFHIVH
jgi:hypothetical protein